MNAITQWAIIQASLNHHFRVLEPLCHIRSVGILFIAWALKISTMQGQGQGREQRSGPKFTVFRYRRRQTLCNRLINYQLDALVIIYS